MVRTILTVAWRTTRALAIGTFILLASITLACLVLKYALGSGSKVNVQKKNLHMIKSTRKSITKSIKAVNK